MSEVSLTPLFKRVNPEAWIQTNIYSGPFSAADVVVAVAVQSAGRIVTGRGAIHRGQVRRD